MTFNEIVIMAGIVLTSISLGYMLRLCEEIKDIAKKEY